MNNQVNLIGLSSNHLLNSLKQIAKNSIQYLTTSSFALQSKAKFQVLEWILTD